jgi:hypothetical protein
MMRRLAIGCIVAIIVIGAIIGALLWLPARGPLL